MNSEYVLFEYINNKCIVTMDTSTTKDISMAVGNTNVNHSDITNNVDTSNNQRTSNDTLTNNNNRTIDTTVTTPTDATTIDNSNINSHSNNDVQQSTNNTSQQLISINNNDNAQPSSTTSENLPHNYDHNDITYHDDIEYRADGEYVDDNGRIQHSNNTTTSNNNNNNEPVQCRHICGCMKRSNNTNVTDMSNIMLTPRICASRGSRHDHETNSMLHPLCTTQHSCNYLLHKTRASRAVKSSNSNNNINNLYTNTHNDTYDEKVDYSGEQYIEPDYNVFNNDNNNASNNNAISNNNSATQQSTALPSSIPPQQVSHTNIPSNHPDNVIQQRLSLSPQPITTATTSSDSTDNWICCDKCGKWRRIFNGVDVSEYDNKPWQCSLNYWDPAHNTCNAEEEPNDDNIDIQDNTIVNSNNLVLQQQHTTIPASINPTFNITQTFDHNLPHAELYKQQLQYFQSTQSYVIDLKWPNLPGDLTGESTRKRFYCRLWMLLGKPCTTFPYISLPTDIQPYYVDLYHLWRAANIAGSVNNIHIADWRTMLYSMNVPYIVAAKHDLSKIDKNIENNYIQQMINIYNTYCTVFENSINTLLLPAAPRYEVQENNKLGPAVRIKILWSRDEDNALVEAVNIHGDGKWSSVALDVNYEYKIIRHTTPEIRNRYKAIIGEKHTVNTGVKSSSSYNSLSLQQQLQQGVSLNNISVYNTNNMLLPHNNLQQQLQQSNTCNIHCISASELGINLPSITYAVQAVEWPIKQQEQSKSNVIQQQQQQQQRSNRSSRSTTKKRKKHSSYSDSDDYDSDSDSSMLSGFDSLKSDNSSVSDNSSKNNIQQYSNQPLHEYFLTIQNCDIQLTDNVAIPVNTLKSYLIDTLNINVLTVLQLLHDIEQTSDADIRRQLISNTIYNHYATNNDITQNLLTKAQQLSNYTERQTLLSQYDDKLNQYKQQKAVQLKQQQQAAQAQAAAALQSQQQHHQSSSTTPMFQAQPQFMPPTNQQQFDAIRSEQARRLELNINTIRIQLSKNQIDPKQFVNIYAKLFQDYAISLNTLYNTQYVKSLNNQYVLIPTDISQLNETYANQLPQQVQQLLIQTAADLGNKLSQLKQNNDISVQQSQQQQQQQAANIIQQQSQQLQQQLPPLDMLQQQSQQPQPVSQQPPPLQPVIEQQQQDDSTTKQESIEQDNNDRITICIKRHKGSENVQYELLNVKHDQQQTLSDDIQLDDDDDTDDDLFDNVSLNSTDDENTSSIRVRVKLPKINSIKLTKSNDGYVVKDQRNTTVGKFEVVSTESDQQDTNDSMLTD